MSKKSKAPSLRQMANQLGCQEKTKQGICWLECNTDAKKSVVIMHGVTGGKIDMMPLAQAYVSQGYAVYSPDLPGHGGSEMISDLTYDKLADWLQRLIDQIGPAPDLIVSNSYASSIVYHFLVRNMLPDKTKVILGCPTPLTSKVASVLQTVSNHAPRRAGWSLYNQYPFRIVRGVVGMNKRDSTIWQWFKESESYKKDTLTLDVSDKLTTLLFRQNPYITSPDESVQEKVTVVLSREDPVVSDKGRARMQELLPKATFRWLDGVGHLLHFESVSDMMPDD